MQFRNCASAGQQRRMSELEGTENELVVASNNPLKTSGYYMYHKFNIQKFYIQLTQCSYVFFFVDLRTNSDYVPIQH
jgi:hypothetical protein